MAARRIPDPKVGGSNPSSLILLIGAFLAQMVERWPFKPMVVGSIPTEGAPLLVGVVGNISACHADARGSIPRRGAFLATGRTGARIRWEASSW